jgi:hypothetical protein
VSNGKQTWQNQVAVQNQAVVAGAKSLELGV